MGVFDVITGVVIGLALIHYARRWGQWWRWRRYVIYPTVPLLWSVYVCWWLVTGVLFDNLMLLTALMSMVALPTLLPNLQELDHNDPYVYLDGHEQLRKERRAIFGFLLLPRILMIVLLFWGNDSDIFWFRTGYMVLEMLPLLFALRTHHKGLMLFWVWLALLGLGVRYGYALGFRSIPMGL